MNGTCCVGCEIEKEEFCAKYIVDGKCSHFRPELRTELTATIIKSRKRCWYHDLVGQKVTLVGDPSAYCGGLGYRVKGYLSRGVLISDMEFDA